MLERVASAGLAAGAAAAATALPHPVVWELGGYPFEAASMIAALTAAFVTRVIIGLRARSTTYALDMAVLLLVVLTTGVLVIALHANLIGGLFYGCGAASIGEGIIRIAERFTGRGLAALGIDTDDDDDAAMSAAMGKLNKVPTPPSGG